MSDIIRHSDWEDRLATYLARVEEEPFRYGKHDCALFGASCVQAQTGVDPAAEFRGKYDTRRGAAEALKLYGSGTLFRTVKSWFGDPKPVVQAKRGDLVMRDVYTVGICVGLYSYFVGEEQGEDRLVVWPTEQCRYAFTLPFGDGR